MKNYFIIMREERSRSGVFSEMSIYKSKWQRSILSVAKALAGRSINLTSKVMRKRLFNGEWIECESSETWCKKFIRVKAIRYGV